MLGMVEAHAQIESNGFAVPEWEVGVYEFHRPTSDHIECAYTHRGLAEQRVSSTKGLLNRGLAERSSWTFTIWR